MVGSKGIWQYAPSIEPHDYNDNFKIQSAAITLHSQRVTQPGIPKTPVLQVKGNSPVFWFTNMHALFTSLRNLNLCVPSVVHKCWSSHSLPACPTLARCVRVAFFICGFGVVNHIPVVCHLHVTKCLHKVLKMMVNSLTAMHFSKVCS